MRQEEKLQPLERKTPHALALGSRTLTGWSAKLVRNAALLLIVGLASRFLRPWIVRYLGKPSPPYWPLWATVTGWLLWGVYWEVAAKNTAPAASSESRGSRRLHVFLVNAALILIVVPLHGLRQRYLPASSIVIAAGLTVQALGILLSVWARRHLGRNWSGEITIKENHKLVQSGPYRVVRHPIYTALLGMYAGSAAVSGELHALLGLTLAVFAYVRKARMEETVLMQSFGANYRDYRSATWALLPGLF
jgi:protein-S-isoprenylcysteine O-methyltransferase Ste14